MSDDDRLTPDQRPGDDFVHVIPIRFGGRWLIVEVEGDDVRLVMLGGNHLQGTRADLRELVDSLQALGLPPRRTPGAS